MKIPSNYLTESNWSKIYNLWYSAAETLSMETGIFVKVYAKYEHNNGVEHNYLTASRIFFQIGEHEFESLHDVKKAIDNKAFL